MGMGTSVEGMFSVRALRLENCVSLPALQFVLMLLVDGYGILRLFLCAVPVVYGRWKIQINVLQRNQQEGKKANFSGKNGVHIGQTEKPQWIAIGRNTTIPLFKYYYAIK